GGARRRHAPADRFPQRVGRAAGAFCANRQPTEECLMSEIVVYGVPGSPFMRAVMVGLEEKGAAYRVQPLSPPEIKSEAYLKRHPFGRVPALQPGDFSLYETQAILRYIDAVFPEPPLQPTNARDAARMNQIIGINDWYFFPKAAATIVFQRIIAPALLGLP